MVSFQTLTGDDPVFNAGNNFISKESFCDKALRAFPSEKNDISQISKHITFSLPKYDQSQSILFQNCPKPIITHIFTFLDKESLANCMRVCQTFREVSLSLFPDLFSTDLLVITERVTEIKDELNQKLSNANQCGMTAEGKSVSVIANYVHIIKKVTRLKSYVEFLLKNSSFSPNPLNSERYQELVSLEKYIQLQMKNRTVSISIKTTRLFNDLILTHKLKI